MARIRRRLHFVAVGAVLFFSARPAKAGPIDFLKRVGASIAHNHHTQPVRRTTRKSSSESKKESGPPATEATATPTPATDLLPTPSPTPTPPTVRAADGVSPQAFSRADLPYGVPVPNKPGFVTSPYSPNGGYVDVHGYPSGIEVKDPYTGKIFRTP